MTRKPTRPNTPLRTNAPRRPELSSGLASRQLAVVLISAVMHERRALDEAWGISLASRTFSDLEHRDRAFARLIAATVLRRHAELTRVVQSFLDKPLPERRGRLMPILLAAAAQLLLLGTPAHAAISQAVDQCRLDRDAHRFDKLANAVLRRVAERGASLLSANGGLAENIPAWLLSRWKAAYGDEAAQSIAAASLREAALDLSMKDATPEGLEGLRLPTGTIRIDAHGRIEDLPGYADGAWWVQDAAAALPAKLLGDISGLNVADLCAAPGGKTAELAAAGARVTAVDVSAPRMKRVAENLSRLQLDAEMVTADVATWAPGRQFDAVLLDAPCTATGTIRRHPDILHLKRESDVGALGGIQRKLLRAAAELVRPGGTLVFCTCSMEAEEGPAQIATFLAETGTAFRRVAVEPGEAGIAAEWISPDGDLRTLPSHLALEKPELSGMDGFFAARLTRTI